MKIKVKKTLQALLFLIPALLLISIFFLYPLVNVFITSFQEWEALGDSKWIGLENYKETFQDSETWQSLWNTVIYTLIVTPMILFQRLFLQ